MAVVSSIGSPMSQIPKMFEYNINIHHAPRNDQVNVHRYGLTSIYNVGKLICIHSLSYNYIHLLILQKAIRCNQSILRYNRVHLSNGIQRMMEGNNQWWPTLWLIPFDDSMHLLGYFHTHMSITNGTNLNQ